ncbi:hypothetical protein AA313_de0201604 [Arthrobotrys entomopaga]|nr:hypothetical protein AA313_de0201604 [Arthrobotrys entomopaga]
MVHTSTPRFRTGPARSYRVRQRREPRPEITISQDANYHIALAEEHYAGSRTKEAYESLQRAQAHPSYHPRDHELRTGILYILIILALTRPFYEDDALILARNHCGVLIQTYLARGEPYSQLLHDAFYAMALIHIWRGETEDAEFCKLWVLKRCPGFTRCCGTRALLKHWKEFEERIAVNEQAKSSSGYRIWPEDGLGMIEVVQQPVTVHRKVYDIGIWGLIGLGLAVSVLGWATVIYGLPSLVF